MMRVKTWGGWCKWGKFTLTQFCGTLIFDRVQFFFSVCAKSPPWKEGSVAADDFLLIKFGFDDVVGGGGNERKFVCFVLEEDELVGNADRRLWDEEDHRLPHCELHWILTWFSQISTPNAKSSSFVNEKLQASGKCTPRDRSCNWQGERQITTEARGSRTDAIDWRAGFSNKRSAALIQWLVMTTFSD